MTIPLATGFHVDRCRISTGAAPSSAKGKEVQNHSGSSNLAVRRYIPVTTNGTQTAVRIARPIRRGRVHESTLQTSMRYRISPSACGEISKCGSQPRPTGANRTPHPRRGAKWPGPGPRSRWPPLASCSGRNRVCHDPIVPEGRQFRVSQGSKYRPPVGTYLAHPGTSINGHPSGRASRIFGVRGTRPASPCHSLQETPPSRMPPSRK